MHTCANHQEDSDDDEEVRRLEHEMIKAREVFATVKVDRANKKADKGKTVHFDGAEVSSCPKPGPSSKTTVTVEEVASPQVKATASKPNVQPNPKATVVQPAATTSAASNKQPANQSSTQFRYTFPLEDKGADKRVTDRMLDTSVSIPIRELIVISTDVRKVFKDMTTTKRVTVGAMSINELSSAPSTKEYLESNQEFLKCSDDSRIVVDHFKSLWCIRAVTYQGRF
jgi:glutamate synthase domain-containing protein 2